MGRKNKDMEMPHDGETVEGDGIDGGDGQPDIDLADVESDLSRTERERDEFRDQLLRLKADFDNYRRRSRNELAEVRVDATVDVVTRWLPVIENLERAEAAMGTDVSVEALREGMAIIHKSLAEVLRQEGVTTINPIGEPYDEQQMEAMGLVPHPDVPDGHVIEVVQRGRMLGDRLMQPARVIVSSGAPASAEKGE